MDWITVIESLVGGVLGGSATVFGLSRLLGELWLEKQKARYTKELEEFRNDLHQQQARMQAEIDRTVFVTRAHFETEFLAMKEVSQYLAEVKIVYRLLNPLEVPKSVDHKELAENVGRLSAANDAFLQKLESWAAFLEPDLYDEFER